MLKFINAPIGGRGSSPATILRKYSKPDKPRPASARARGSSQLIVRVRASFPVSLIILFPSIPAAPCRSGTLAKRRFALFQESSDPFDEVRRMEASVLIDGFKVERGSQVYRCVLIESRLDFCDCHTRSLGEPLREAIHRRIKLRQRDDFVDHAELISLLRGNYVAGCHQLERLVIPDQS